MLNDQKILFLTKTQLFQLFLFIAIGLGQFIKKPTSAMGTLAVALVCTLVVVSDAAISSMTYAPQGNNPLLYQPGAEPIMHLDQGTFSDTIFDPTKRNSFVVEFYADW